MCTAYAHSISTLWYFLIVLLHTALIYPYVYETLRKASIVFVVVYKRKQ